ncbi:precorrin-2 dehydrogenase / sirohydrochlorin ferrochelatase [Anaerosphaera aminiphila DSM 21120]|uniref:precorrin-2 dehydrogenase n=1 Tax=Anaerosphaera aminiphila DSM 21120 TaxID=1120995 RepID=A0A1M5TYT9_9FIRM|nr:NAD(P)-dependent oxidoreductase [Anaerosphaera aminiphila]SHH55770.1 precorrin-2 dehydrogenase / sirohydrochlorin ferrochelatase [Anaerosphaera aminiphila DSM 21120]
MRYLPVSFDTRNKNVLVLGGGLLSLSKIKVLLKTEFNIYVISDTFVDEIYELEKEYADKLFLKEESLDGNFIFFAYDYVLIATNDFVLNNALEKRAQKSNILYERCDVFSNSTMLMNRILEKGGLAIGITTDKLNPTISDIIYEDIEKLFETYDEEKIKILNRIRAELVRKNSPDIDNIIRELYATEKINLNTYLNNLKVINSSITSTSDTVEDKSSDDKNNLDNKTDSDKI